MNLSQISSRDTGGKDVGKQETSEDQITDQLQDKPQVLENECDSLHLLYRKTESFRCLQQVMLSSSAVMRNKDFRFPPLHDPGINEAFHYARKFEHDFHKIPKRINIEGLLQQIYLEIDDKIMKSTLRARKTIFNYLIPLTITEPEPVYDDVGTDKYNLLCKELHIVPISRIMRSLSGSTMNLKYYGLTPKQMHALTETMKINTHISKLILQDNWLNCDVTEMLSNMLEENTSISVLNLRECRIGTEGAEKLSEALSSSQFLTELDLSFNSLGDKGLLNLQSGLCGAPNLKVLNISHNDLTEDSADTLERILLENKLIQELDLSWNSFCTGPGNKKLFKVIKENDSLRILNIAWNGINLKPAAAPLSNYLKKTNNLEFLDVSCNRLEGQSLRSIRAGILKNHSLKHIKMGNNFCSPDEALFMASVLPLKQNDPLRHLDMENIVFDKKFLPLLVRIKHSGKTIKYGSILGNYTIKGPDINKLIFQRCRYILEKPKKKKLKKDFGHFILSLPDEPVAKTQFSTLLKKKKIKKLDQDLIKELCNRFSTKNQNVDCMEMKRVYMKYYPDTSLPPPQPKKKKKGKGKKGKEKKKRESEVPAQQETVPSEQQPEQPVGAENETKCVVPPESTAVERPLEESEGVNKGTIQEVITDAANIQNEKVTDENVN